MRISDGSYFHAMRTGDRGCLHEGFYGSAGGFIHAGSFAWRFAAGMISASRKEENWFGSTPDPRPGWKMPGPGGIASSCYAHWLECQEALYLGRGINMPIAYEGALKLKGNFVYPRRGVPGR